MRNSGWYIPFWRRPKKKGRAEKLSTEEVTRSDEQLEAVRQRWVDRYRRMIRSLNLMGLSMGSNRADVQARYEHLRAHGRMSLRELEDAYRFLIRVLPPQERRKRRGPAPTSQEPGTATTPGAVELEETAAQPEGGEADTSEDDDPGDDEGIEAEEDAGGDEGGEAEEDGGDDEGIEAEESADGYPGDAAEGAGAVPDGSDAADAAIVDAATSPRDPDAGPE